MSAQPLPVWHDDALCDALPADWWVDPPDPRAEADAKKVCRQCPSAVACRAAGMDEPHSGGIWGGLSEDDRRYVRRRTLTVVEAAGRAGMTAWELSAAILSGRGPLTVRVDGETRIFRADLAWWVDIGYTATYSVPVPIPGGTHR